MFRALWAVKTGLMRQKETQGLQEEVCHRQLSCRNREATSSRYTVLLELASKTQIAMSPSASQSTAIPWLAEND